MTLNKRIDKLEEWKDVAEPQINQNTKDIKSLKEIIIKELKSINLKLDSKNKIWNTISNAMAGGFILFVIGLFIYT